MEASEDKSDALLASCKLRVGNADTDELDGIVGPSDDPKADVLCDTVDEVVDVVSRCRDDSLFGIIEACDDKSHALLDRPTCKLWVGNSDTDELWVTVGLSDDTKLIVLDDGVDLGNAVA